MSVQFNLKTGSGCGSQSTCLSKDGCPPDRCPDFTIRRHDTRPSLKVAVEDCDGSMDLRGLVVEVNMWALAKLKSAIDVDDTYFRLADDVGFEQVMLGDIIVMDRVRMPEYMLVTGFDETNKLVEVQRGYHGTTPCAWPKANSMRIFRVMNAPAQSEIEVEDVQQVDGTKEKDVIVGSYLIYEWQPEDTCLPGCYWLEFKVLKMTDVVWYLPGGNWQGEVHKHTDGYFYTGSAQTGSSVRVSYDQIEGVYLLPKTVWAGENHLYTDANYYTGESHNNGSVALLKVPASTSVDELGILGVSVIPSFTDEGLTPYYFGCILGEGVEWTRRFPKDFAEGFLIRIIDSPTKEI